MKKFCFCGTREDGGVDAVHVGPNDKLVGIDTFAISTPEKSELFLPSVVTRHREFEHESVTTGTRHHRRAEEESRRPPDGAFRQFVGEHRGTCRKSKQFEELTGNGGHARLFKSGSEEASAEALAVGCEQILQRGATSGARLRFRRRSCSRFGRGAQVRAQSRSCSCESDRGSRSTSCGAEIPCSAMRAGHRAASASSVARDLSNDR